VLSAWVASGPIEIDRPRGWRHPRYPSVCYPLDYGYLCGTVATDGEGLDVWIGSRHDRDVTGVVCTIDAEKRDVEIKVLLGCTQEEMATVLGFHNQGTQSAVLMERFPRRRGDDRSPESE
jgi:inorganic pyrophosphatase